MRKTLLLLLLFISASVSATHIVGGEFRMFYLGRGNQYQLVLTTYLDDIGGNPAAEVLDAEVGIYKKATNEFVAQITLSKISRSDFLDYDNASCSDVTNNLRTRVVEYGAPIILSQDVYDDPGGYYVVWQQCCRNHIITNIIDPGSTGAVFYMEFPSPTLGLNYSPVFSDPPVTYLCIDRLFSYDFSAFDPDGDSLVYEMVDPWATDISAPVGHEPAPYQDVDWGFGYNSQNAIPGAMPLQVDAATGVLSVIPSDTGLYVFAVSVKEYRDGVQIGEVRRDFQIFVSEICAENHPPDLFITDSGLVSSTSDTIYIKGDEDRCSSISVSDSNDVVVLTIANTNFPANMVSLVDNGLVPISGEDTLGSGKVCWDNCADSEGEVYELTLNVEDEGCPFKSSSDKTYYFIVDPVPNDTPRIHFSSSPVDIVYLNINEQYEMTVSGAENDGQNIWLEYAGALDLFSIGADFDNQNGQDSLSSVFTWEPTCDHSEFVSDTLIFKVFEESCGELIEVEKELVLNLIQPELFNADYKPSNVLTPNGDGANDCFEMTGLPTDICGDEFQKVVVYNRWGKKVYENKERVFKWCDIHLSDGVYFYRVEYDQRVYTNWVTIIR